MGPHEFSHDNMNLKKNWHEISEKWHEGLFLWLQDDSSLWSNEEQEVTTEDLFDNDEFFEFDGNDDWVNVREENSTIFHQGFDKARLIFVSMIFLWQQLA